MAARRAHRRVSAAAAVQHIAHSERPVRMQPERFTRLWGEGSGEAFWACDMIVQYVRSVPCVMCCVR